MKCVAQLTIFETVSDWKRQTTEIMSMKKTIIHWNNVKGRLDQTNDTFIIPDTLSNVRSRNFKNLYQ